MIYRRRFPNFLSLFTRFISFRGALCNNESHWQASAGIHQNCFILSPRHILLKKKRCYDRQTWQSNMGTSAALVSTFRLRSGAFNKQRSNAATSWRFHLNLAVYIYRKFRAYEGNRLLSLTSVRTKISNQVGIHDDKGPRTRKPVGLVDGIVCFFFFFCFHSSVHRVARKFPSRFPRNQTYTGRTDL